VRWRWYILAALVGGLATSAIIAWPTRPLWKNGGPLAGAFPWFSSDGRTLFSESWLLTQGRSDVEVWEIATGKHARVAKGDLYVDRLDAATGKLLGRVTFPCAASAEVKAFSLSPDGRLALVGEASERGPDRSSSVNTVNLYLHDGLTGGRLAGPIAGVNHIPPGPFSPDGRWFWGWRVDPLVRTANYWPGAIFSASTGQVVLPLPERDGLYPVACVFDAEGNTAAMSLSNYGVYSRSGPETAQIIELPSGRERHRFALSRPLEKILSWDGQRLRTQSGWRQYTDATTGWIQEWVYDLSKAEIHGEQEPLPWENVRSPQGPGNWSAGQGLVVHAGPVPRPPRATTLPSWFDWLSIKLGARGNAALLPDQLRVRLFDRATGALRRELSCMPPHFIVSKDGSRLLCRNSIDGRLEVWATDPPLRWPRWAGAFGLGTLAAGGVLAIGRWRSRNRKAHPIAKTTPITEEDQIL
jgi:hypothetical protein